MKNKILLSLITINTLCASSEYLPTYSGNTGIFETPNARIMPDWHMRTFFNIDKPFSYYGIGVTPLPFLETNFHVTQINGINALSSGYGDYKDKALNFKLQLKEEDKIWPSIVIGGDDVWGTALYTSKYIATSKKIGYFDFTLGYAKGRLGGEKITTSAGVNSGSSNNRAFNFMKDLDFSGGKPFGSLVFNASPNLFLMAEYSSINYKNDYISPFDGSQGTNYEDPKSKINFGLKYKIKDNSILSLSYQRGNTLSFGYTYQFGFNRTGAFEHLPDTKWKADYKKKQEYANLTDKELVDKLSNEVAAESFRDVQTSVNENKIWSEIENSRYNNDLQAVGRAISTIDEVAPKKYDTIYMTLKEKNAKTKTFKVNRKEFDSYENNQVSDIYMENALTISTDPKKSYEEFSKNKENIFMTKKNGFQRFNYYIGPTFKTYLNAPEKPFAMKVSAQAKVNIDLGAGFYIDGKIQHPLYNNINDLPSSSLESEKLSIRSNSIDYFRYNDTQLKKLTLTHVRNLPLNTIGKVELGYFDLAYAGVDLELAKSFFDDKLTLGLQYQKMKKRKVDNLFKMHEDDLEYDAKFLNASYLISPKYNMFMSLKAGEFLAGDKGVRIDFSRSYRDFTLGAFATFTNSDEIFETNSNKGYIDKGVYIKVPLEVFTYKNVKGMLNYGLSPWTRDAGQFAGTSYSLYNRNTNENNLQIMKKNINYLKK